MNTIDVMKDEKCIVRLFYGSAQPSGWCRQFIAQEQWNRCQPMRKRHDIIAKTVKQVLLVARQNSQKQVRQVGE